MPIYYGHGQIDPRTLLPIWIVLNGLSIVIAVALTIRYFIIWRYSYEPSFLEHVFGGETLLVAVNTTLFGFVNIIALIVFLIDKVTLIL